MSMIFKVFRKLKFYLDKAAYIQGVPQSGGPSITKDFNNTMEIYADIIKKYGNLINEIHLSLNDKFILEFFPNIPESQNKENNVKINKIVAYYPFTNLQIDISKA